eukprot:PhM_4_TR15898/c2_g1_i3/m.71926
MFFLEAIAAKKAAEFFIREHRAIWLATDNKALMFAIRKRSTACPRTAVVLAQLFKLLREHSASICPGWIPTEFNPADCLSRGYAMDSMPGEEVFASVQWTSPPGSRWGPRMGRVVG